MNLLHAPIWKKIFWGLSLLTLIIMPALSPDFAQNGDEDVEAEYGRNIIDFYVHGDQQALDYNAHPNPVYGNHMVNMHLYGGMFDMITEAVHRVFPSWHVMDVRHFFASLFGAALMIFTGLLAYRLSHKKWWVATLALLFILFSPRIFGESMNNGKDIPFATGMTMGIYFLVRLLQDFRSAKNLWKEAILLAVGWGIVFGMRSAGGALFIVYAAAFIFFYYLCHPDDRKLLMADRAKGLKRLVGYLLSATAIGFVIGLLSWPFGLTHPIDGLLEAVAEMSKRQVNLRVLFQGIYYSSLEMPWYYELKWIFITNPIIVLLLSCAFILLIPRIAQRSGGFAICSLLFAGLFPLIYIIYKDSTVYDTWRHVFFVYPFWVIMAAMSVAALSSFLKERLRWVPAAVAVVALLPAVFWTIRSHPNQYVFFNAFTGGVAGAFGQYDLDYYVTSSKQSAEWILENIPKPPDGKKIIVLSNMGGLDQYFGKDTSWITTGYARYYDRHQYDWDYYITYGRFVSAWQLQHGKWPPAHVVHAIMIDGVPIGVVLKRSSKQSYLGYQALQKGDFALAASLYESYLKSDSSDEMVYMNYAIALASTGRMQEAITALQQASRLDASRPDFYEMMARIYQAMGKPAEAQKAIMTAQSILAQEALERQQK